MPTITLLEDTENDQNKSKSKKSAKGMKNDRSTSQEKKLSEEEYWVQELDDGTLVCETVNPKSSLALALPESRAVSHIGKLPESRVIISYPGGQINTAFTQDRCVSIGCILMGIIIAIGVAVALGLLAFGIYQLLVYIGQAFPEIGKGIGEGIRVIGEAIGAAIFIVIVGGCCYVCCCPSRTSNTASFASCLKGENDY